MSKISEIYAQLFEDAMIENYAEYDAQMLAKTFDLEIHDARTLFLAIQGDTNIRYGIQGNINAFMDALAEAQQESFDGWTEEEIVVIKAFIADVSYASKH